MKNQTNIEELKEKIEGMKFMLSIYERHSFNLITSRPYASDKYIDYLQNKNHLEIEYWKTEITNTSKKLNLLLND